MNEKLEAMVNECFRGGLDLGEQTLFVYTHPIGGWVVCCGRGDLHEIVEITYREGMPPHIGGEIRSDESVEAFHSLEDAAACVRGILEAVYEGCSE